MSHLSPTTAPLLVAAATADEAQALREALLEAGEPAVLATPCAALVQWVEARAPRQVLCRLPEGIAPLLHALAAWRGAPPCPITWIGPVADAAALVEAGIASHCSDLAAAPGALAEARARHARERALREELAAARAQLDERKWIDRAKGVLMSARSMPEDEAFKLLRGAAMHANLKLVQVSRAVVDAARWAEAVNRAGQLRMLSQRLLALAVMRLLRLEGARTRATQALARAQENVDFLAAFGLEGSQAEALAATVRAWEALRTALAGTPNSSSLQAADARAEHLLEAAEALTERLEEQGGRRALGVVNLCGRQRMRSQRVAKEALLATLAPDAERSARLQRLLGEFEQVLVDIEAAPLSSPEIRRALADAREGWLVLLRALRSADAAALASASENLLAHLDRLTESCEHSLQTLLS
ncbi:MAG: ANTAR domain-containing protein [Burkholderiales bacterium]|nr:ANTAR domain-containing protein [Burkholderiales bacterium]